MLLLLDLFVDRFTVSNDPMRYFSSYEFFTIFP